MNKANQSWTEQDLLDERCASVDELRAETDILAREMIAYHLIALDQELARRRGAR